MQETKYISMFFQRVDGRCKSTKQLVEIQFRSLRFLKEKPSDVVIRRSSAAYAEFGWYREIQHRFVPIYGMKRRFFILKEEKNNARCKNDSKQFYRSK